MVELACLFKPEPHKLHVGLAFVSQFLLNLLALDLEVGVHKHAGFHVVRQRRRNLLLGSALGLAVAIFRD